MRKSIKFIFCLLMFFILPLTISSVYSEFIYFSKGIEITTGNNSFNTILKPFDFVTNKLPPEIQNKEDATENHEAHQNIMGDPNGTGLHNPNSLINADLGNFVLPKSYFITSIDSAPNPCRVSGADHRVHLGVSSDVHFAIHRAEWKNLGTSQVWKIYTTKYPIHNIKVIGYDTLTDGTKVPIYNTKYIENIYCTTYKWSGIGTKGKYVQQGNVEVGYAPVTINKDNNPYQPFFDINNFKSKPEYVRADSIKITDELGKDIPNEVINIKAGEVKQINAKFYPKNAVTDDTLIYSSDNENIAHVDSNGKITAINKGTTKINVSTTNANKIANPPKTDSITINVSDGNVLQPRYVDITSNTNIFEMGSIVALTANVTAADHITKPIIDTVVWSSSDNTIASVDSFGLVTIKHGFYPQTATITATSSINKNVKQDFIMSIGIPKANTNCNGDNVYKKGIQTNVEKDAHISSFDISLISTGFVYPDKNNHQILSADAINNDNNIYLLDVEITSLDPNATVTCYIEQKIKSLNGTKYKMTTDYCTKISNNKYRIEVPKNDNFNLICDIKGNKPVKYNLTYAGTK